MRWLIGPFSFWFLGSLLLMTPQPGYLWYKHSASPRYHTVGRASGLLIGVRRSPYLWRRDILTGQQKVGDKAGDTYGLWWGTGTDHHLYPDPEEKSTLFKKLYKTLEKERSHGDGKEKVEDGENINAKRSFNKLREHKRHFEQQSCLAEDQDIEEQGLGENKLMVMEPAEIETSLEDKHFSVNDPALVKSSLRFNNLIVMEPRVKKRMLEETWLINNPGEQTGSLEQVKNMFTEPVYEARSFDKEMRDQLESDEDKELKVEQIQPMSLTRLLHRDSRDYLQLWRRHLARPKQSFYPRLQDSEWINCEDLAWTSHKILCKARLYSRLWPWPKNF